jgi:type VI secretion system protein ImpF
LSVRAIETEDVLSTHNVIEFEIRGLLWAQPVPLEMLLRTQLELEAGKVEVRDLTPGASSRPPSAAGS